MRHSWLLRQERRCGAPEPIVRGEPAGETSDAHAGRFDRGRRIGGGALCRKRMYRPAPPLPLGVIEGLVRTIEPRSERLSRFALGQAEASRDLQFRHMGSDGQHGHIVQDSGGDGPTRVSAIGEQNGELLSADPKHAIAVFDGLSQDVPPRDRERHPPCCGRTGR